MRKHKFMAITCLLIGLLLNYTKSEENFEDADQSNDFLSTSSNTNQNYDLRHTIPGEPGVDYPIYFSVPKTSFKCSGRHEGYYADTEARCQAFRICAHTARSAQGFGFLCPNGTLFSQKNFVCDWYRNVNCDESERYYSKNDVNRVGSNYDMMETVRQMMEYPMKTITKALQQNTDTTSSSSSSSRAPNRNRNGGGANLRNKLNGESNTKANSKVPAHTSRKSAVTRAQIESAYKYDGGNDRKPASETESQSLNESEGSTSDADTVQAENLNPFVANRGTTNNDYAHGSAGAASDDIYVNSLGELSSDPGANFDEQNSRIIAKAPARSSYQYGQKLNFAEKVNEALKGMVELPTNDVIAPDYVKKLRSTAVEDGTLTDLASNVNGLLDEVENDLDPSMSGYQIPTPNKKHAFKFLSRGFSAAQGDRNSYVYTKPKQTASTIRFSPNQIPIDSYKTSSSYETSTPASPAANTFELADDAMKFSFMNIVPQPYEYPIEEAPAESLTHDKEAPATEEAYENAGETIEFTIMTTTTKPVVADESYLTAPLEEVSYLEPPPRIEETDNGENVANIDAFLRINVPDETDENSIVSSNNSNFKTPQTESPLAVTTLETLQHNSAEILQKLESTIETEAEELTAEIDNEDLEIEHQKLSVNQHAENLLLSGVKLSIHEAPIKYNQLTSNTSPSPTKDDTAPESPATIVENFESTTTPMSTSTETVTEISSTQQRIRNYRRFATLQRASVKPLIYAKRAHVRNISKTLGGGNTITSSTTKSPPSTSTTRSYLKRVAASRLRLSRLNGAAGRNGSASILNDIGDAAIDAQQPEKKLSIRNLDKETATLIQQTVDGGEKSSHTTGATWESVRNNLQRYVSRKRTNGNSGYSYATTTTVPATTSHAVSRTSTTASQRKQPPQRQRNRFSNFKIQPNVRNSAVRTTTTTLAPRTTATPLHSVTSSSSYSYTQIHPSPAPPTTLSSAALPQASSSSGILSSNVPSSPSSSLLSSTSWSSSTSSSSSSTSTSSSSSSNPSNFLSFDKLTRAIVDDSILQNFRSSQVNAAKPSSFSSSTSSQRSIFGDSLLQSTAVPSGNSVSSFNFGRPVAQTPSQLTPPVRPKHLPIIPQQSASTFPAAAAYPTQQTPRIVIARAEGQRIEPNSVHTIISNLAAQQLPKSTAQQAKPYVPLDAFLTHKFGSSSSDNNNYQQQKMPTQQRQYTQQQQQQQQQQPKQQQQYQYNSIATQQQQQPQVQQQRNYYQQHIAPNLAYIPQQQQQTFNNPQLHQQLNYPQQQSLLPLQPLNTQGIFATYKQHQKQLPQFPPLLGVGQQQQQFGNFAAQQQQQQQQTEGNFNQHFDSLNVQLPALTNGLIPAPTTQFAQKRSDYNAEQLQLNTDLPARSYHDYGAATSYDVPLNSIGRLPNDRTHILRRLRRH